MSDDLPLALMWREGRWLRIADGPDEVHKVVIAMHELNRFRAHSPPGEATAEPGARPVGSRVP